MRQEFSPRFSTAGRKLRAWREQNGGVRFSLSPGERAGVRAGFILSHVLFFQERFDW